MQIGNGSPLSIRREWKHPQDLGHQGELSQRTSAVFAWWWWWWKHKGRSGGAKASRAALIRVELITDCCKHSQTFRINKDSQTLSLYTWRVIDVMYAVRRRHGLEWLEQANDVFVRWRIWRRRAIMLRHLWSHVATESSDNANSKTMKQLIDYVLFSMFTVHSIVIATRLRYIEFVICWASLLEYAIGVARNWSWGGELRPEGSKSTPKGVCGGAGSSPEPRPQTQFWAWKTLKMHRDISFWCYRDEEEYIYLLYIARNKLRYLKL